MELRRLDRLLADLRTISGRLAERFSGAFSRKGLRAGLDYFNARAPKELAVVCSHPAFPLWVFHAKNLLAAGGAGKDAGEALLGKFAGIAAAAAVLQGHRLELEARADEKGHFHFRGLRTYLDLSPAARRPVVLRFDEGSLTVSCPRRAQVVINRGLLLEGSPRARAVGGNGAGIGFDGLRVGWLPAVAASLEVNVCDSFILGPFLEKKGPYDHEAARFDPDGLERFIKVLRETLWQMGTADPCLKAELLERLRVIIPLARPDAAVHVSSTYSHLPGAVGLCHDESPLLQGETLVHEFSHAQLYGLMEEDPLLEGPGDAFYYSPWRRDPRPLSGILLGAHAFLNVARYVLQVAKVLDFPGEELGPVQEDASLRCFQVELAMRVLAANGRFTARGRELMSSLRESRRALDKEVAAFPEEARSSARASVERHKESYWAPRGGYHRAVFKASAL